MGNGIGTNIGNILMYVLSKGGFILFAVATLAVAYYLSSMSKGLYKSNRSKDPELMKMSEKELEDSSRNMVILIVVLTIGTAYIVWWLSQ